MIKPVDVKLSVGKHQRRNDNSGEFTVCAMEYLSYIAGLAHTDRPECVDETLTTISILLNDSMGERGRKTLRPYLVPMIGTRGDGQWRDRAFMLLDWALREYLPLMNTVAGASSFYVNGFANMPQINRRSFTGNEKRYIDEMLRGLLTTELPGLAYRADRVYSRSGILENRIENGVRGELTNTTVDEPASAALVLVGEAASYGDEGIASTAKMVQGAALKAAVTYVLRRINDTYRSRGVFHMKAHTPPLIEDMKRHVGAVSEDALNVLMSRLGELTDPGGIHDVRNMPATEKAVRELQYVGGKA